MAKKQDTLDIGEHHYRTKIIADPEIFPQHANGGGEELGNMRNELYSILGRDNVESHTHSQPPHWTVKFRPEHLNEVAEFVSSTRGLELVEPPIFQYKGTISIKDELAITELLRSNDEIESLRERLIEETERANDSETNYAEIEREHSSLKKKNKSDLRKLAEARAAANRPAQRPTVEPTSEDELTKLRLKNKNLESIITDREKIDRNQDKYFEYDEKYDTSSNEAMDLYCRAGIKTQIRDVKYNLPNEILTQSTEFNNRTALAKSKTRLENRIKDIGNFTSSERSEIIAEYVAARTGDHTLSRSATLGEVLDSEIIWEEYIQGSDNYRTTKNRIFNLEPIFGRSAKTINRKLTRHFKALSSLIETNESVGEIKDRIKYLSRIQDALEKHDEMIKYRSERDRIKARIENG